MQPFPIDTTSFAAMLLGLEVECSNICGFDTDVLTGQLTQLLAQQGLEHLVL